MGDSFEITTGGVPSHQWSLNPSPPETRPNILLLMTDQQRFDTICAAGCDHMHTPNLDRLANEGCLYTHAYSPQPICLPARHSMLTGLPPRYHGFPDNAENVATRADLPTIPRILSDNGYETRAIGKMHFRPPRRHNGFEKLELMEELAKYRECDEYGMYLKRVGLGHILNWHGVRNLLYMVPQRSLIPEEHHGTTWVADRTIDFLRTNRGRHPFFLFASWIAPHPPFDVPATFADLYQGVNLPEPYISQTPTSALSEENKMLGDLPNPACQRRMRELYYSAISLVDKNVGRILDTLDETGLTDNTLILFVSDHGELLGDYGMYQKWLPYDSAARIPFIVRYPKRLEPGSLCHDFVDLYDILPTVLSVAGVEYPADFPLPGESLFSDTPSRDRNWQYTEYAQHNRRWISVRNRTYKYNYYYGGGFEELFDLQNDPHETTNLLAGNVPGKLVAIRHDMRHKLHEVEARRGLEGYVTEDDFKEGPPYTPQPERNKAFPSFQARIMDPDEQTGMNDFLDEVARAVAPETDVPVEELDLEAWQRYGGFSDQQIAAFVARVRLLRDKPGYAHSQQ